MAATTGTAEVTQVKPAQPTSARARSAPAVVVAATAAVSLVNYGFSLLLLWIMPARDYAVVASVTALLLVFGTVAGASAPWVLAREVAVSAADPRRRSRAIAFAAFVASGQAATAGLVALLIVARYGDWETAVTACGAAVVIFFSTAAAGYLQGTERFTLLYVLRVAEVLAKVAVGFTLVKLGTGSWGVVAGFAFGALVVLASGMYSMRGDVARAWRSRRERWMRGTARDRALWRSSGGIIGIQAGTAVIAGLDSIIASVLLAGAHQLATYQVVQILGRIPFFVASSLAVIVFPRMARLRATRETTVNASLHALTRICGGVAFVVGTAPVPILGYLLPDRYGAYYVLLPWAAVTGFSLGGINLVTTYWQATGKTKSAAWALLAICGIATGCDVLAVRHGDILHLAWSAAATSSAGLVVLLFLVRRDWPTALRGVARQCAVVAVPGIALVLVRGSLAGWLIVAVAGLGLPVLHGLYLYGLSLASQERPRILHLAFEDPCRPGAGGGSLRTAEVNRRVARDFTVTVVCARYQGSATRTEQGVRYVHVGLPWGQKLSLLSYFACLPWALLRYPSDLVVEDFAAPFSTVAVPWLTSRPVVGVVQWLFAREKAAQYGLPFHLVERIGLASHRNLVAVSADLGAELRRRNPRATVHVIENGLPEEAFAPRDGERRNIVFLGRLEIAQKGLDMLLHAFAAIADSTGCELTIAGSGPDEAALRMLAHRLGVSDRVVFAGHVPPAERFELLAAAALVAMPSRYETYGLVAAEALAVGTPVVAFDIPCLRSIVSGAGGVLVPAFDTAAYATALADTLKNGELRARLGRAGRQSVARFRWEDVAVRQRDLFADLLTPAKDNVNDAI
jgi:glycosyltransferase involved in cell wall biosynthesis/O-antigen/teichoic acid export membrane protein